MSDLMLLGVLRMPRDLWTEGDALDQAQRESRYKQAADRIEADEREIAGLRAQVEELQDVLLQKGFTRCDIPACNCGSWHHRYGLPERWQEIQDELRDADVLDNSTGNKPLNAIKKLRAQRDVAIARSEFALAGEG